MDDCPKHDLSDSKATEDRSDLGDKVEEAANERSNSLEDHLHKLHELALLPEMEYDKVRKKTAEEMGLRVATLDGEVKKLRMSSSETDSRQGQAIELYEPEPWPTSVDGVEILNEAADRVSRHMKIRREDTFVAVLWAVHTHLYKCFSHTPRLLITAPEAECGKTLLMTHMVGNLVTRPQSVEMMKPAPFFRFASSHQPTFLIDEVDVFIRQDSDLIAAINGGWEPHGGVIRCAPESQEVKLFETHCPVAMAGIDIAAKLPQATLTRCIVIQLERAIPGEIADDAVFNSRKHTDELLIIGRKIARWCADNIQSFDKPEPILPSYIKNRNADKWSPLFAIAQTVGGDWTKRIIDSCKVSVKANEPSKGNLLLNDLYYLMDGCGKGIRAASLIDKLCEIEESTWKEFNDNRHEKYGYKIRDKQIAKLLKPYGIRPDSIREGTSVFKGYKKEKIVQAWHRYIKVLELPKTAVTQLQRSSPGAKVNPEAVTDQNNVTSTNLPRSTAEGACNRVTDQHHGGEA